MASSTVPAVKRSLVTLLAARATLSQVQVSYGAPIRGTAREFIWVGDVEGGQSFASLGVNHRDEEYAVKVVISVVREGNDQQSAETRCFDLMAELEDELRDTPQLATAGVLWSEVGDFQLEQLASDQAVEARLTVDVRVRARI